MKTYLTIDNKTIIPVTARAQECKTCKHLEFSKKEQNRLKELARFYRREKELLSDST